jgi:repressor LexA
MKDIGIYDGDLLAVHKTDQARNGQVVVARLNDEVTVKRFQRNGNQVQLIAENQDFSPIEVDLTQQHLSIEGLSVGVIRRGN